VRAGRIENGFIPKKTSINTAVRLWLRGRPLGDVVQGCGYRVIRIPKLPRAAVGDASKRRAARRPPIGGQNWLPNHEHAHLLVWKPGQKLFGCGGPPQTSGSSGGYKQNQARDVRIGVKGSLEFAEIGARKRNERLLARRNGRRTPKIPNAQQHKYGCQGQDDGSFPAHLVGS